MQNENNIFPFYFLYITKANAVEVLNCTSSLKNWVYTCENLD